MHSNWRPDHFWIDFDGTLTAADTIAALGEYASSVSHTESAWDDAVAAYLADYAEAVKSTPVPPFPVPPILSQIDNPAVRQALAVVAAHIAAVRPAEDASLARIHRAGIFRGLSARGLTEAVQHRVELAAGALDALAAFGDRVTVCSVNWSADWIAGALSPWCGRDICCSDLAWNGEMEVSTGIQPTIVDGMDKLATMQRRGFKPNVLVVAVGDAINDLPCLLAADVGILLRHSGSIGTGSLRAVLDKAAVSVVDLTADSLLAHLAIARNDRQPTVFLATSWAQISALIQ